MRNMKIKDELAALLTLVLAGSAACSQDSTAPDPDGSGGDDPTGVAGRFVIIDTGQKSCYDADGSEISSPSPGEPFYGQDGQFDATPFAFTDNGDGTVTDLNSGLMWQQTPSPTSVSWQEAMDYCDDLDLAGHDDWRAPTLKELFSISDFSQGWLYLDTNYFDPAGARQPKDEQFWSSNFYHVGTTHGGQPSAFGVNHGTGHIKTYPAEVGGPMGNYVRAVRGEAYGVNDFVDNGDGTITDNATRLMWMQNDFGEAVDWEHALFLADTLSFAGHGDWRLSNVRELQSIVDYSGTFPAIDSLFSCTVITNEAGEPDYGYYWTGTSAYFGPSSPVYCYAWYVAFGRAVGGDGEDLHGAGAVRFDTKVEGGPGGEGGERIFNHVRLVRDVDS